MNGLSVMRTLLPDLQCGIHRKLLSHLGRNPGVMISPPSLCRRSMLRLQIPMDWNLREGDTDDISFGEDLFSNISFRETPKSTLAIFLR